MNIYPRLLIRLIVLSVVVFLSGCGAAPTIRDSKIINKAAVQTDRLIFVYRQSEMKTTSSYGKGSANQGETGFYEFGKFLINQAPNVFETYGVKVTNSRELEARSPLSIQDTTGTANPVDKVLLLHATSGHVSANNHATRISYIFEAQLLDVPTRKLIWKASIDTSTWSGRDFLQKNIEKTTYDDKYAKQLLQVVAKKLKEDGVI
jgi:hypothetical protein